MGKGYCLPALLGWLPENMWLDYYLIHDAGLDGPILACSYILIQSSSSYP